jgi:hypothetical protein
MSKQVASCSARAPPTTTAPHEASSASSSAQASAHKTWRPASYAWLTGKGAGISCPPHRGCWQLRFQANKKPVNRRPGLANLVHAHHLSAAPELRRRHAAPGSLCGRRLLSFSDQWPAYVSDQGDMCVLTSFPWVTWALPAPPLCPCSLGAKPSQRLCPQGTTLTPFIMTSVQTAYLEHSLTVSCTRGAVACRDKPLSHMSTPVGPPPSPASRRDFFETVRTPSLLP